jgi:enolase
MDKVKEIVVLKNLLHESVNGDEHGIKPDLTESEMKALEWAIEQAEKVEQLEKDVKFWKDLAESCECNN